MNSYALSDDGDLFLNSEGSIARVFDTEQIQQNISQRLYLHEGEWEFNIKTGVPWKDKIFTTPPNLPLIESIFKQTILQTPGVISLFSFRMEFDTKNRILEVLSFEVQTEFGVTGDTI